MIQVLYILYLLFFNSLRSFNHRFIAKEEINAKYFLCTRLLKFVPRKLCIPMIFKSPEVVLGSKCHFHRPYFLEISINLITAEKKFGPKEICNQLQHRFTTSDNSLEALPIRITATGKKLYFDKLVFVSIFECMKIKQKPKIRVCCSYGL